MGTAVLTLLILIVWISIHKSINSNTSQIESLKQEIFRLKKMLQTQNPEIREEKEKKVEPKRTQPEKPLEPYLKVLSVEEKPEEPEAQVSLQEEKTVPAAAFTKDIPAKKEIPLPKQISVKKEKKKREPINLEKFIGENLFGKIGILVLVIGMGFFVKYAIDKNYINEVVRTVMGFAVGFVLLFIAWRLRNTYRTYSSLLSGGAFAIFYVTVAMAYHYYGLFSQPVAFAVLIVVTLLMSGLAILYDRRELAIVALAGGFIAPFLISSGEGNYLVLFTYVLILDAGMFILSFYKRWGELPVICFLLTWIVLFGYTFNTPPVLMPFQQILHLLLFSYSFYLLFLFSIVGVLRIKEKVINLLLLITLTLNNFVFMGIGMWLLHVMNMEDNYGGILTLFIGFVNLMLFFWVRSRDISLSFLWQTLLATSILFVSIAIPVQLEGTLITIFWASEMLILLWFYSRYKYKILEFAVLLLPLITVLSYLMDVENGMRTWEVGRMFLNGTFITGKYTGIAFGMYAWMQSRMGQKNNIALWFCCILLYITFVVEIQIHISSWRDQLSIINAFTVTVLLALSYLFHYLKYPMMKHRKTYKGWLGFSFLFFLFTKLAIDTYRMDELLYAIQWYASLILALHFAFICKIYYSSEDIRSKEASGTTIYLSIISTVYLLLITNNLLNQWGWKDESSAGVSVALGIAGFVQMALGMRLHSKLLRMISLFTFGIVISKLLLHDLWLLPTVGKVIVFILLGSILLLLSFLYQKLKAALFGDEENKELPVAPQSEENIVEDKINGIVEAEELSNPTRQVDNAESTLPED